MAMAPLPEGGSKNFGKEIDAYVAVVRDNVSLKQFLTNAGQNCECLERFVNKEIVYFTGSVYPEKMEALKIRHRKGFRVEVRNSNVLLLSVKGKPHLSLAEALEIVKMSKLKDYLPMIEAVAAVPSKKQRSPTWSTHVSSHAYIKFANHEIAKQCVNIVDAMPYKGFYVHSPQLDANTFLMRRSEYEKRPYVWSNEKFGLPLDDSPNSSVADGVEDEVPPLCDNKKKARRKNKKQMGEDDPDTYYVEQEDVSQQTGEQQMMDPQALSESMMQVMMQTQMQTQMQMAIQMGQMGQMNQMNQMAQMGMPLMQPNPMLAMCPTPFALAPTMLVPTASLTQNIPGPTRKGRVSPTSVPADAFSGTLAPAVFQWVPSSGADS